VTDPVAHDMGCQWARPASGGHSDAARRVCDTYNLHRAAGEAFGIRSNLNKIFACALADGTSDGVLYDTRADAIRHQHHNEKWYAYLRVERYVMGLCSAERMLKWHREAYDKGLVFVDRDTAVRVPGHAPMNLADLEIIPRITIEDHARQLAALRRAVS
jgi:hypothetical protein